MVGELWLCGIDLFGFVCACYLQLEVVAACEGCCWNDVDEVDALG